MGYYLSMLTTYHSPLEKLLKGGICLISLTTVHLLMVGVLPQHRIPKRHLQFTTVTTRKFENRQCHHCNMLTVTCSGKPRTEEGAGPSPTALPASVAGSWDVSTSSGGLGSCASKLTPAVCFPSCGGDPHCATRCKSYVSYHTALFREKSAQVHTDAPPPHPRPARNPKPAIHTARIRCKFMWREITHPYSLLSGNRATPHNQHRMTSINYKYNPSQHYKFYSQPWLFLEHCPLHVPLCTCNNWLMYLCLLEYFTGNLKFPFFFFFFGTVLVLYCLAYSF